MEEVQPAGVEALEEVHTLIDEILTADRRREVLRETLLRLRKECTIWGTAHAMAALDGLVAKLGPADEDEL